VRAVHAALEMRERLEVLNSEFEHDWGVRIQVRTGVNTGEVATDESNLGDAVVVGDPVNVAARLQQAASPGEILLGTATSHLVRDAVQIEELEPLALKGRGGTVRASRVLGLDPSGRTRFLRPKKPLVGRD